MTSFVVRARSLSQAYGPRVVLRPLDLDIRAGERVAVLGDNGSGKTTLLRLLATAGRPAGGTLELFGSDAVANRRGLRRRIGYLAHQAGLYPRLTVEENLEFFRTLFALGKGRVAECLDLVGLTALRGRLAAELSRGQQQRGALARSLLHDPELWVLDEPDASLDRPGRELLTHLIGSRTVVLATHDRGLAAELCARSILLADGAAIEPAVAHLGIP